MALLLIAWSIVIPTVWLLGGVMGLWQLYRSHHCSVLASQPRMLACYGLGSKKRVVGRLLNKQ